MGEILLCRMYAGEYLNDGIGHEFINLFQCDNGRHYVFVTPHGDFGKGHSGKIQSILFVRKLHSKCVEVIGKAEGLNPVMRICNDYVSPYKQKKNTEVKIQNSIHIHEEQIRYIRDNGIKYGDVWLDELLAANPGDERSVYITFEAEIVRKAKRRVLLSTDKEECKTGEDNETVFVYVNGERMAGSALAQYLSDADHGYKELQNIIRDESYWREKDVPQLKLRNESGDLEIPTFMQVIGKENEEIIYSKLLKYYLEQYPAIYHLFMNEVCKVHANKKYRVETEFSVKESESKGGRIDILLEDDENVIVIENKIRSSINGIIRNEDGRKLQDQLDVYYRHIERKYVNKNRKYFILVPDYNASKLKGQMRKETAFEVIVYSKLLDFFGYFAKEIMDVDKFGHDFMRDLQRQAQPISDDQYEIMMKRVKDEVRRHYDMDEYQ